MESQKYDAKPSQSGKKEILSEGVHILGQKEKEKKGDKRTKGGGAGHLPSVEGKGGGE